MLKNSRLSHPLPAQCMYQLYFGIIINLESEYVIMEYK